MGKKRFRLRHTFWLDVTKSDEADLAETIDNLKRQRSFTATIRDGIRLICDLRVGRLDVLLELFPWITEAILDSRAGGDDGKIAAVNEQIAQLERLLLSQDGGQVMRPVAYDDMPVPVLRKSKAGSNSAANFIGSAFAVAGMQVTVR